MSQLLTVVQCDCPAHLMRNKSVEEESSAGGEEECEDEDEDKEASWRRILAVSLLVTALFLVGGAIYLHMREAPQDQSQQIYPNKKFLALGIPTVIAIHPDMSEIPQDATNFQRALLYKDDYYNSSSSSSSDSNSNSNSGSDSDSDSDSEYDEDSDSEYYYDGSSGDAKDNKHNNNKNNKTITKSAAAGTSTDYSSESTEEEEDVEVEVGGDDFRPSLKKEQQKPRQMELHNPNISSSTASTSSPSSPSPSSSEANHEASGTPNTLSELCLQCICETATECQPVECGPGVPCGLFRISLPYWVDAGRLRLRNASARNMTEHAAYLKCVNDPFCAQQTVAGNIAKFARDCNHDGKIDCSDHAKLHILGPTACLRYDMPPIFATRLERCMAKLA